MTVVMTLKESYCELILNSLNVLTTLSIRNTMKPERKKNGRMVIRSMTPSKDVRNLILAFPGG